MFERFTERARLVVVLAQEEARTLKHNFIGSEHLLLGVIRESDGIAARALTELDITVDRARAQVVRLTGSGEEEFPGAIPFTPRAKKVLEQTVREALAIGHRHIGTEHILLALVSEPDGTAARVLHDLDADADKVRTAVLRLLSGPLGAPPTRGGQRGAPGPRPVPDAVRQRPPGWASTSQDPADAWPVTIGHQLVGDLGSPLVDREVLLAILAKNGRVAHALRAVGIDEAVVRSLPR